MTIQKPLKEELENGFLRLTAPEGYALRHRYTKRIHSEAIVQQDDVRLFEVV